MSMLTNLKLVAAKRPGSLPQIVQRRNRLISKIWEQTELAKAQQAGTAFRPTLFRSVKDAETGERRNVEVQKRVRAWWWTAENGKVCMHVRYGTKTIELAKGKTAIEIGALDDLIPALEMLKAAVAAGELDGQIEAVSGQMRSGFIGK
jgi:tellurite resistance protein